MFRFTIRDVLWLTALVAVLATWLVDRSRLAGQIDTLKRDLAELRIAELRAKELRGEVILPASPSPRVRKLERDVDPLAPQK